MEKLVKEISKIFELEDEEIKEALTAGAMLLASAGLLFAGKKAADFVERKIREIRENEELSNDIQTLLAGMKMILDKHEYKKRFLTQASGEVKIKEVAPPPPPPVNSQKEENDV
jgi:hypothetical protein